jgi:hypothetical protein
MTYSAIRACSSASPTVFESVVQWTGRGFPKAAISVRVRAGSPFFSAVVVELADAPHSKRGGLTVVRVRVSPSAPSLARVDKWEVGCLQNSDALVRFQPRAPVLSVLAASEDYVAAHRRC